MSETDNTLELERARMQLADAQQQINSLKIQVRTEELKVKISSEYSDFALWDYDIVEDVCYLYKKLHGRYESDLTPIVHFRDTVLSWGAIYSEDIPVFNRYCDALQRGDQEVGCDVRCMNDDHVFVWYRYEGRTVYDDNGKPLRVIGRTLDVTAEKGGIGDDTDARRDPLTGTYTVEVFRDEYRQRTSGTNRFNNSALLLVGIDALDRMCEQYGEEYCEYVRKTVAKILLDCSACRHDSCVGRTKDDEFGFFSRFTDMASLQELAEHIIYNVSTYNFEQCGLVTISIGFTVVKNAKSFLEAYTEASVALRAAEAKGGSGYLQYSASMIAGNLFGISTADTDDGEEHEGLSPAETAIFMQVNQAFVDKESRARTMSKAIRALGELIGADHYVVTAFEKNGHQAVYSHLVKDDVPAELEVRAVVSTKELQNTLDLEDYFWLERNVDDGCKGGFALDGNATNAIVILIKSKHGLVGWMSYSAAEPLRPNSRLLRLISHSLNKMFTAHEEDINERTVLRFAGSVINNLRIEGFTVAPDTYVVDYVGENCEAHYDMRKGDVCYKKIYGREKPCRDCPIAQLENKGQLTASSARYNEKEHKWLDITASAEENLSGEKRYLICATDITNCLGMINNYDNLTGVMTFDMFTAEAMRLTSGDAQGYHLAVINVAGFRRINEDNGFEFGNSILIAVADILEHSITSGEIIGRSEGSRFLALFKNRSVNELESRLNQLMASIQKQVYEKCAKQIYLIVGVYEMSGDGLGIMTAIDRAITAQKTVKDKTYYQENLIAQYNQDLREELKNRRYIEAHMLDALENDEFKVFYQPKVSIKTGKIVGAEALVRWIRKDGEIISPGKFVPIFEANGFIADMDFAIYRHAIADIKRWLRKGYEVPLVSLNVSRHHLRDDTFSDKLNALVDSLGIPHNLIELEITESMLTENLSKLVDTMTKLKSLGFRISIDDFGSGYSSLNLITLLPFDTLKIDGGFFLRNDLTERNRKVISSVVTLAKSLNLETVSEGVEMQEQVDFLRDLGCDTIQGYFYYKPMPSADFEKLIAGKTDEVQTEISDKREK